MKTSVLVVMVIAEVFLVSVALFVSREGRLPSCYAAPPEASAPRLYHIISGSRRRFAEANLKVTSGEWHEPKVECAGNKIVCYYDGVKKIEAKDDTFKEAGKIGLWTKVDSVTYFDDLRVSAK